MDIPLILPVPDTKVRIRCASGEEQVAAAVRADSAAGAVILDRNVSAGAAELIFASPRGVITLTGAITAGFEWVFRADAAQVRQRREAFRLSVGLPMSLTRADGSKITGTVTDLSIGGALLGDRSEPLHLYEQVHVTIDCGVHGLAAARGTVIRLDGIRRAVQFDTLSAQSEATIERLLSTEQRRRLAERFERAGD